MLPSALSPAGLVLLALQLAALTRAAVVPNTPATANVGAKCTITWQLDTTKVSFCLTAREGCLTVA